MLLAHPSIPIGHLGLALGAFLWHGPTLVQFALRRIPIIFLVAEHRIPVFRRVKDLLNTFVDAIHEGLIGRLGINFVLRHTVLNHLLLNLRLRLVAHLGIGHEIGVSLGRKRQPETFSGILIIHEPGDSAKEHHFVVGDVFRKRAHFNGVP